MRYQDKSVEILSTRNTFGKSIAQIRILSTGQILDVSIEELSEDRHTVTIPELSFKAMAARIRNEVNSQKILSPFESNIIPLPHQILALEKVMSGAYLRFLMADEVGMGKTIEAGLVLKELKLRGIVKRTLVIVSVSAMHQWRQELKRHFNETFHVYDSEYINTLTRTFTRLDADNEINIWAQHNQLIVSIDALKPIETRQGWSREKVDEYNRYRIQSVLDADFDLLILDECHKVGGGSSLVGRYQMAQILCNAIPNVLLLSATPHRGKSDHFRRILGLLDADAFSGEGMPSIPELEPFVVRTEKRQAIDYDGNPLFNKRITQRVVVPYDPIKHARQQQLYNSVTEYVVNGFNLAQQTRNTSYGFVMVLFQRLMSSSTQAILDAMERRALRLASEQRAITRDQFAEDLAELGFSGQMELDFESRINEAIEGAHAGYAAELQILQGLVKQARECASTERDAKIEYLIDKLAELKRSEDNSELKFLVFTEFTGTQAMLKRELEQRGGYICESINGSMDYEERVESLKKFKENAQVLISTDAAGESLNMQFAHIIINYDMPWNPMVIEQRIGRVDRIGQEFIVQAINLMLDNSIDERVYEIIETKLDQIMAELGIDKTSDVLDSTLERESVNALFLASLLDPERFKSVSDNWLSDIKNKLTSYKSTEGALPTLNTDEIKAGKTDSIKYSPLPSWLEAMTEAYLESKSIPYTKTLSGHSFRFPGFTDQIYIFNAREGINNPIPEPLTLQHDIIQTILNEAVPVTNNAPIPVIHVNQVDTPAGYWTLWALKASNAFDSHEEIHPLFMSDEGDIFTSFAQDLWIKLSSRELSLKVESVNGVDTASIIKQLQSKAEETLVSRFSSLEQEIIATTGRISINKEKAFEFQERQLRRVGIDNIRKVRLVRLLREKLEWEASFQSSSHIIPDLICLMVIRVCHE